MKQPPYLEKLHSTKSLNSYYYLAHSVSVFRGSWCKRAPCHGSKRWGLGTSTVPTGTRKFDKATVLSWWLDFTFINEMQWWQEWSSGYKSVSFFLSCTGKIICVLSKVLSGSLKIKETLNQYPQW